MVKPFMNRLAQNGRAGKVENHKGRYDSLLVGGRLGRGGIFSMRGKTLPASAGIGFTPNAQHQRRKPAEAERRIQTGLNGWLPSAEWCGSAL